MGIFDIFKIQDGKLKEQLEQRLSGSSVQSGRVVVNGDYAQITKSNSVVDASSDTHSIMDLISWHEKYGR